MTQQKHIDVLQGTASRVSALIGVGSWGDGPAQGARGWELERCLGDIREELGRGAPSTDRLALLWWTRAAWLASLAPWYERDGEGYSRLVAASGQLSRCAEMLADAAAEEFL